MNGPSSVSLSTNQVGLGGSSDVWNVCKPEKLSFKNAIENCTCIASRKICLGGLTGLLTYTYATTISIKLLPVGYRYLCIMKMNVNLAFACL